MAINPLDAVSGLAKEAGDLVAKAGEAAGKAIVDTGAKAVETINAAKEAATAITIEDVLRQAMKIPGVKVNRASYLKGQLNGKYSEEVIKLAIAHNPAFAGIGRNEIARMAKASIAIEAAAVAAISFGAGIPGGPAMAATIPADIAQYYAGVLRIMQKLAYLYGFNEIDFDENTVSDETMSEVILFLGVMCGVQGAGQAVAKLAEGIAKNVAKEIIRQPLMKTTWYPIMKKVASAVGAKLTKQILADGITHSAPIIGGFVSGGFTLVTFTPSANRLKNHFRELPISDPSFYEVLVTENDETQEITEKELA